MAVTTRRPHFRRVHPQQAPGIEISNDDLVLIRHLHEHRVRRSTDLVKLLPHRSPKKILERLPILFHTQYIDRPQAQRDLGFTRRKRVPYIYALGNRGAELIAEIDGIDMPRTDWTDKNRDLGRLHLMHQLLIGDIVGAFHRVPQVRPDVAVIAPATILERAPQTTRKLDNPWKWHAKIPTGSGQWHDSSNIPDAVIGLDFTQARKRMYFLIEADRSTMPVVRSNPQQTSVQRKLLTYWHAHRARFHEQQFGISNFRVMVVTTSALRIASIVDAVKAITNGAGSALFLFCDAAALAAADNILTLEWINGKGARVHLSD